MKLMRIMVIACFIMLQAAVSMAGNQAETITFSFLAGGYTFQGNQHMRTSPVYGFRLGYNLTDNWAVEGVVDALTTKKNNAGNVQMFRYGGDLIYNFMPKSSLVPFLAVGVGGTNFNNSTLPKGSRIEFNYGGGLKWFLHDNFALRADVRGLNYTYGKIYTNVEYTLGMHIPIGVPKPAPKPVVVEPPPPPPAPAATLSATPDSIEKGNSTTLTWTSQNATECDIQPGIGPVPPQGSRQITPSDTTSYTITCKGEGGSANGAAKVAVTLPPPPPPAPEPQAAAQKATAANTRITLDIEFDTGKWNIKKKYDAELQKVGDVLNQEKNLKGIIEGNTDTVGGHAMNMRLSHRRADAVKNYIIKNFKIDKNRLAAKGYGPDKPIADNKTAEGRQKNRRVDAVFEEIPNFNPNAEQKAEPAKKAKKKTAKKKAPAKQQ